MIRAALLVGILAITTSGCIKGMPVRDAGSLPGALPFAAIRAAPPDGREQIMLTAGIGGRFRIDAECVLIEDSLRGPPLFPFFYDGTRIGRDQGGFYIRDGESGAVFRDGDRFVGGGGYTPIVVFEERYNTRRPVPDKCRERADRETMLSINPGIRKP